MWVKKARAAGMNSQGTCATAQNERRPVCVALRHLRLPLVPSTTAGGNVERIVAQRNDSPVVFGNIRRLGVQRGGDTNDPVADDRGRDAKQHWEEQGESAAKGTATPANTAPQQRVAGSAARCYAMLGYAILQRRSRAGCRYLGAVAHLDT